MIFGIIGCFTLIKQADARTEVGGIIDSNATWTLSNSPYEVIDTVQIPAGVTLTIEPGVTVAMPSRGNMFALNGTLYAHGTSNNKITLDGGNNSDFFNVYNLNHNAFLDLEYCEVKNGLSLWSNDNRSGYLNLQYSELSNLGKESVIWFPPQNVNIKHNKFIDSYGFEIHSDKNIKIYIENNLFYKGHPIGNADYWNYFMGVDSRDTSEIIIKNNSYINNTNIVLKLLPAAGNNTFSSATNNYWGTEDISIIKSMIYDKEDDITVENIVNYLPVLAEPHLDTPTISTCNLWVYSNWGKCINGKQTRIIISSSPDNCVGGNPILNQDCASQYLCTSWTYSHWGACSNGQQTRTITFAQPSGCPGGSPILNQSCQNETKQKNTNTANSGQEIETTVTSDQKIEIKSPSQSVILEEKSLITKIDNALSKRVSGNILLQVENKGEGWYVYPDNKKKYYLGRPADAFSIMRNLGLGIKHNELTGYLATKFPSRLSGKILLDVEKKGEAYYINPNDLRGYYLNKPTDAFRIMRELGLGITNTDIRKIDVGETE